MGTLCVLGHAPRPALDARETELLAGLAGLVMDRLELRRAERARNDAQKQFERMTAAAPGAVVCADRAGRITHWNSAAEHLFGWSRAEAVGQLLEPESLRTGHAHGMARVAALSDQSYPRHMIRRRRCGMTATAPAMFS